MSFMTVSATQCKLMGAWINSGKTASLSQQDMFQKMKLVLEQCLLESYVVRNLVLKVFWIPVHQP